MTLPMMGNPPPAKSQLNGISGAGWQVKSSPQSPWHPRVVSSSPVKLIIHWMCLNSWRTAFIWLCRPVTFFFVYVCDIGARICIESVDDSDFVSFWFCVGPQDKDPFCFRPESTVSPSNWGCRWACRRPSSANTDGSSTTARRWVHPSICYCWPETVCVIAH